MTESQDGGFSKEAEALGRHMETDTVVIISKDITGHVLSNTVPAETLPELLAGVEAFLRMSGFVFSGTLVII